MPLWYFLSLYFVRFSINISINQKETKIITRIKKKGKNIAYEQGDQTKDFNLEGTSIDSKYGIRNQYKKYNINFNFRVTDLYNLKMLIANITIKLKF